MRFPTTVSNAMSATQAAITPNITTGSTPADDMVLIALATILRTRHTATKPAALPISNFPAA